MRTASLTTLPGPDIGGAPREVGALLGVLLRRHCCGKGGSFVRRGQCRCNKRGHLSKSAQVQEQVPQMIAQETQSIHEVWH